jgi:DoxX-like protein
MAVSKRAFWTGRVISILVSLMFVFSATMKIKGGPELYKGMEHLELAGKIPLVPLSILELSCVAVYLIPPTSVVGAILLTGYLGGAILTHWRVGDMVVIHIVLGILIWLGLWLREERLKALIPLRRPPTS